MSGVLCSVLHNLKISAGKNLAIYIVLMEPLKSYLTSKWLCQSSLVHLEIETAGVH